MDKLQYCVVGEKRYHQDIGMYQTYGLLVRTKTANLCLRDISVVRSKVEHMAAVFNRVQLAPVHLKDAVENMLP